MNITIDPEFKALIPPLAPEELAQLEANIIKGGCRDPLVVAHIKPVRFKCYDEHNITGEPQSKCSLRADDGVWKCDLCGCNPKSLDDPILIDGHNRHAICTKHDLPFDTVEMEFATKAHARIWMRENQKGRRNLTPAWLIELELGNKADFLEISGDSKKEKLKGNQNASKVKTELSQNDNIVLPKANTQKQIAKAAGVSTGQVGMAEQVKKKSPELWEKAKAGEVSISSAYKTVNTHVGHNTGENEWYTPPQFVESARVVMGSIDLDPASSEIANRTVKSEKYYSKEDNGLDLQWHGNVWMNPPYAQPLMSQFAEAVAAKHESGEVNQAIVLVNNATETQWWQRMARCASAVCFPKTRIRFLDPDGNPGAPLQGQSILYFGESKTVFVEEFSKYGATYS